MVDEEKVLSAFWQILMDEYKRFIGCFLSLGDFNMDLSIGWGVSQEIAKLELL